MVHRIETELGPLATFELGDGPAVFLWPSLYMDHRSLEGLIHLLADDSRCIAVDGPGHGGSPGPGRRYDMAACARAAIQVLDALGVREVDWVGNAWGGHVGVRAAIDFPERVRSLTVIAAPLHRLEAGMRLKTRLLLLLLRLRLTGAAGRALVGAMLSPRARAAPRRLVRESVQAAPGNGLADAIRCISLSRKDITGELPRVRCPTFFVAGGDDSMYPPARASAEAAGVRGARLEVVEGAAHLVPLERPEETAVLVRAHLVRARGEPRDGREEEVPGGDPDERGGEPPERDHPRVPGKREAG